MTRPATAFLALLLLSAPMVALSQQTATEEVVKPAAPAVDATATPAPAAPAAETAPTADAAPAAQPKAQMEEVKAPRKEAPQMVVTETHGDWEIICAPDGAACAMAQKGKDPDGHEIMEVRIRRLEERTQNKVKIVAAIQIAVPIGVILPPGVALQIDSAKPLPAAYRSCNQNACLVQEAVDEGLINAMKKGAKAVFTIVAPPKVKVPVEISLSGFTAAYNALKP